MHMVHYSTIICYIKEFDPNAYVIINKLMKYIYRIKLLCIYLIIARKNICPFKMSKSRTVHREDDNIHRH